MTDLALLPQAFQDRVRVRENGCWEWLAGKGNGLGEYGTYYDPETKETWLAHRFAYTRLIGPIPEGKVLDHFKPGCSRCANPHHTEPVTQTENIRRHTRTITHCPRGHEYTEENTITRRKYSANGRPKQCRECRTCGNERRRKR